MNTNSMGAVHKHICDKITPKTLITCVLDRHTVQHWHDVDKSPNSHLHYLNCKSRHLLWLHGFISIFSIVLSILVLLRYWLLNIWWFEILDSGTHLILSQNLDRKSTLRAFSGLFGARKFIKTCLQKFKAVVNHLEEFLVSRPGLDLQTTILVAGTLWSSPSKILINLGLCPLANDAEACPEALPPFWKMIADLLWPSYYDPNVRQ